jgi:cell division protein FtsI (penicillin-binding protein 3)
MLTNQHKVKITLIFTALFACYSLAIVKLYLIQIRQTGFFKTIGNQQYRVRITATPERAFIYDRTGIQPLALNKDSISAFIVPNNLHDADAVNCFLQREFPSAYERLKQQKNKPFMYIKRQLTPAQKEIIEAAELSDIQFLKEPSRYYPVESTGPIIGTVDSDNQGTMGIELLMNETLAGTKSSYLLEQDARSGHFYFKKETTHQGSLGKPVHLTIDSTIQFLAYEELQKTMAEFQSTEGAAIIMNPDNGDIIALVNYPDFDANNTEKLDLTLTKNRVITQGYELGSVMKTFLALGLLAEGLATPETTIDCEGKKTAYLNGIRVNTWKEHGLLTVSEIIEHSNNIGTTKLALMLGNKIYDHYRRCGFGEKTGINFPGEQRGIITHPSTWSKQSLASLSYGYEIRATLLQLASAFCMIANDGVIVKPRLLLSDPIQKSTPVYSPEAIAQLKEILTKTITQGTARKANIKGYKIMGKTGSARLLVDGKYQQNKNIFTFSGIVERGRYKRVIIVFIQETNRQDVYASSVAAPLFEHIAEKMLIHDRVI